MRLIISRMVFSLVDCDADTFGMLLMPDRVDEFKVQRRSDEICFVFVSWLECTGGVKNKITADSSEMENFSMIIPELTIVYI